MDIHTSKFRVTVDGIDALHTGNYLSGPSRKKLIKLFGEKLAPTKCPHCGYDLLNDKKENV